jgi:hypothetical protein
MSIRCDRQLQSDAITSASTCPRPKHDVHSAQFDAPKPPFGRINARPDREAWQVALTIDIGYADFIIWRMMTVC